MGKWANFEYHVGKLLKYDQFGSNTSQPTLGSPLNLWGPSVHVDKSFKKRQTTPPPLLATPVFWEHLVWQPIPKSDITSLFFSTATELGGKFDLEIYCCDGAGGRQGLHFVFTPERKVGGTVFFQHIQQWRDERGRRWSTCLPRGERGEIVRFPLIQFIRVSKSFEKIPIFDFPSSWDYISFNTFLRGPFLPQACKEMRCWIWMIFFTFWNQPSLGSQSGWDFRWFYFLKTQWVWAVLKYSLSTWAGVNIFT